MRGAFSDSSVRRVVGIELGILVSASECVPGPQKYVEQWPFGLYLGVLGHYFTYFGGLGESVRVLAGRVWEDFLSSLSGVAPRCNYPEGPCTP